MKHLFSKMFVLIVMVAAFATTAYAEHLFGPDQLDTTYGATFRLRQEIWDRAFDFNTLNTPPAPNSITQNRNFLRLKTTLWGNFDYDKKVALKIALTNEMKYYFDVSNFRPTAGSDTQFAEDELIFDNLYVDLNLQKLMNAPVTLRLGRQDFLFTHGEGFLILDGTPGDGSRTFFFNAFKANIKFNENNNLDLIYITDPRTDIYLPVMYTPPGKIPLNTSDEQGFVVYSRNKLSDTFSIEPFYIWKHEDPYRANTELDIHTFGSRAVYSSQGWKVRGELAYQTGDYDSGRDRTGWGGYLFVNRAYNDVKWKPSFDIGYMYLSGDDPNTAKHEGWDPLFNRCPFIGPMYSELFIFSLVPETAGDSAFPAYWTNLQILRASGKLNFTPETNLGLAYNYLWASEKTKITSGPFAPMFTNNSKDRGSLLQAILSHKFNKNIDGLLHLEYFIPGDFYSSTADDSLFFRWQLQFKI